MADCPIVRYTFYRGSHSHYLQLEGDAKQTRVSGASSWGKQIESTEHLDRWKRVSVLTGAAGNPELLRRFANATERDEQDRAMEAMMNAAKAHEGRDWGADAHRVTELHDKGLALFDDLFSVGIIERWNGALQAAGIEILPTMVERVAINPELRVCAIFDRVARHEGKLKVVDLKTGRSGVRYSHTMTVQLAVIANCSWVTAGAGEPVGQDGTTWTEFEPMPDVDRTSGLIISLPRDDDND